MCYNTVDVLVYVMQVHSELLCTCLNEVPALSVLTFPSLAQVHEDRATPSGRGEDSRADAPVSPPESGEARPKVCCLV